MAEQNDEDFFARRSKQRVTIGHDTWIGHGVVTKDVPPHAIVGGGWPPS